MSNLLVKRLVGTLAGVICALLILFIGFWRTLLIAVLAFAGWWLTGSRQIPQVLIDFFVRILHRQ